MNAYFFKMTPQEKNNILDQHKTIYDGYVTQYVKPNEQPLYIQDFANDKNGITLNNKGNVSVYKNMSINEADAFTGSKYVPEETFEEHFYMNSGYNPNDRIGDGENDLIHGTVSDEENQDICPKCGGEDPNCEICGETEYEYDYDDDETKLNDDFGPIDLSFENLEEQEKEQISEQVKITLEMFKRFKKFN